MNGARAQQGLGTRLQQTELVATTEANSGCDDSAGWETYLLRHGHKSCLHSLHLCLLIL